MSLTAERGSGDEGGRKGLWREEGGEEGEGLWRRSQKLPQTLSAW